MTKLKVALYVVLLIFLANFIYVTQVSASGTYTHTYYVSSEDNPSELYGMPFWSNADSCEVSISNSINVGTDTYPYTLTSSYYIPTETLLGTYPPLELNVNSSCFYTGSSSSSEDNATKGNFFDSRSTSIISGSIINKKTILSIKVNCTTEDNWIEIYSNSTTKNDNDDISLLFEDISSNLWYFEEDEYNSCVGIDDDYISNGTFEGAVATIIIPFTTGETGQVLLQIYDYTGLNYDLQYYELDNYITSYTYIGLTPSYLGNWEWTLKPNTKYAIILNKTGALPVTSKITPDINISIMTYIPNWVCGEWSECIESYKSRTCTDPEGIANNKIETEACFPEVIEDIYLGFEDGVAYSPIRKCVPEPWNFCRMTRQNISTEYPIYWTVNNPHDYNILTMTDEFSSERGRSLKMWWIPPYTARPRTYGSGADECVNDTVGHYPYITGQVDNSTILNYTWIGLNLTFPNPYMKLVFDVKNCEEPVEQFNVPGGLFGWGECGQGCYAPSGNCSIENQGRYFINLLNLDTNKIIVQKFGEAKDNWENVQIDLSNNVINTYNNYSIVFGINPLDITESVSRCAYFDNVRLQYTSDSLPCVSRCEGDDYISAELYNATCITTIQKHSPECFDEEFRDKILAKEGYCVGTTWYFWDTNINEWVNITSAVQCVVVTTETETPSGLDPVTDFMEAYGMGDFVGVLSLAFLSIILSVIIPILIIKGLNLKEGAGTVFIIMFIIFLIGFSVIGLFPAWITIIFTIIAGFILAKTVMGFMGTGT